MNDKQERLPLEKWGLYSVPDSRTQEMAEISARAFVSKNDPIGNYMFEQEPDSDCLQREFFRSLVTAVPAEAVLMASSVRMEAVSIWFSPQNKDEKGGHADSPGTYLNCCAETRQRVTKVLTAIETLILECAPPQHWYLHLVAVEPEYMGRGYSSKLILPMLHYADDQKIPSTLVTQHAGNIALYEHLGFRVIKARGVPSTDLNFWFMQHNS